jgi:hypothetical protein
MGLLLRILALFGLGKKKVRVQRAGARRITGL